MEKLGTDETLAAWVGIRVQVPHESRCQHIGVSFVWTVCMGSTPTLSSSKRAEANDGGLGRWRKRVGGDVGCSGLLIAEQAGQDAPAPASGVGRTETGKRGTETGG